MIHRTRPRCPRISPRPGCNECLRWDRPSWLQQGQGRNELSGHRSRRSSASAARSVRERTNPWRDAIVGDCRTLDGPSNLKNRIAPAFANSAAIGGPPSRRLTRCHAYNDRKKETDVIITRWLTASHILKVTGNRGFWWVETRKSPGVVPPPTPSFSYRPGVNRPPQSRP